MIKICHSDEVLIVGWYGTETAGDKAILFGVIDWIRGKYPTARVTVSSLHPFVTRRTLSELGLQDIRIAETYSKEFESICSSCNAVVVGGGPLMDIEPLDHILFAFLEAKKRDADRVILGCGLGPLTQSRYLRAVREILKLATYVGLRDGESGEFARTLGLDTFEILTDPAIRYVEHCLRQPLHDRPDGPKRACFFLRHVPDQYLGMEGDRADAVRSKLNTNLSTYVADLLEDGWEVRLLPMHSFVIGDDDRIYNRMLARRVGKSPAGNNGRLFVENRAVSASHLIEEMRSADQVIAMRYHSVFFASEIGANFAAIDYTSGGKVFGYLKDKNRLDRYVSLTDLSANAPSALHKVFEKHNTSV